MRWVEAVTKTHFRLLVTLPEGTEITYLHVRYITHDKQWKYYCPNSKLWINLYVNDTNDWKQALHAAEKMLIAKITNTTTHITKREFTFTGDTNA